MFVLSSNHYQNYQSPSLQGNIQALSSAVFLYLYMIIGGTRAPLALYINSAVSVSFSEASTNLYTEHLSLRAFFLILDITVCCSHHSWSLITPWRMNIKKIFTLQVTFNACKLIFQSFFCYGSSIYTEMLCSPCR